MWGKNISSVKLRIEIELCQFERNKWLMRTDTGCTCRVACTSLPFCCISPRVRCPPARGIEPWKMLPLRPMIEGSKEGRSPETTQCLIPVLKGNTGALSLDGIVTIYYPGQEMPLVPSCRGSIFSDFCPCPVDQLCGVARIVTGIFKVTLLRQQSHCWVSLPAFLGIFFPSSCPGFSSVLAWPAGIVRDPLAHMQGAGDLCVPLASWFLVDTASKTPSQFFNAFCNCNSLF